MAARLINLSAGNAVLPLEVLTRAQQELVDYNGTGQSVLEMGYRTPAHEEICRRTEALFREVNAIPDDYEVLMTSGGASLLFSTIPMNLLGESSSYQTDKSVNVLLSGYWSKKTAAAMAKHAKVTSVGVDAADNYFALANPRDWQLDASGAYFHYTSADTRQGLQIRDFPHEAIPEGMLLVCDMSADFGSRRVDVSKFDIIYVAGHKNFSTAGVTFLIIRKSVLDQCRVCAGTPDVCNWQVMREQPCKQYNVPIIASIWIAMLVLEWMKDKGGVPYFEELAPRRANILYDFIDASNGFYRTFVTDPKWRSWMHVVFYCEDNELSKQLVAFLLANNVVDARAHPLGANREAIRVTMYNPQPIEQVIAIRDLLIQFQAQHVN